MRGGTRATNIGPSIGTIRHFRDWLDWRRIGLRESGQRTRMGATKFRPEPPGVLEQQRIGKSGETEIGWALRGRRQGGGVKKALLDKFSGSDRTQKAVERGLEWLAKNQQLDGSWSLVGPYSDGVFKEWDNATAATAMALLAFQGNGNTHLEGKYKKNVANAWRWLQRQQDATGCFFQRGPYTHRFYTHGMCSIAVCELYAMSKDAKYRRPAQSAIDYCLRSQSSQGGWRDNPNADSDVSVTGWVVMALQSARMGGLKVPAKSLDLVGQFLDSPPNQMVPVIAISQRREILCGCR